MFQPYKSDTGAVLPWEYLAAEKATYQVGQLLNTDATTGQLEAIAADQLEAPGYMSMSEREIETAGDILPVTRISEDMIYETTLAEAVSGLAVGMKLQIESGGLGVSKPASGEGCFEVVDFEGAAIGDIVHGRFVAATPAAAG